MAYSPPRPGWSRFPPQASAAIGGPDKPGHDGDRGLIPGVAGGRKTPLLEAELPPIRPYHPTTFLERGVAVPFTTPRLGGTRARPAKKHLVELVVPNLSGGRGVYVMPWTSLTALCRPTLHDKVFSQRIASITNVTPATIRRVARQIAAEGLAERGSDGSRPGRDRRRQG